jgi:hypothetical protein
VTVYVLTWQGVDPFVPGGVPIGVFATEAAAWDAAAESAALGAYRQHDIFPRQTWTQCVADLAFGYQVFPLELDL